jgi:hypothetical protein
VAPVLCDRYPYVMAICVKCCPGWYNCTLRVRICESKDMWSCQSLFVYKSQIRM